MERPDYSIIKPARIEKAFEAFYDYMRTSRHFRQFFSSEAQIDSLVVRQRDAFICSLHMDETAFQQHYRQLGFMHAELGITLEDLMAGLRLIRDQLLRFSEIPAESLYRLIEEIERYLAQGYFQYDLAESEQRLTELIRATEKGELPDLVPREVVVRPVQWLLPLLKIWAEGRPVQNSRLIQGVEDCSLTPLLRAMVTEEEKRALFEQQHAEQHTTAFSLDYFVQEQEWTLANSLLERVVFLTLSVHTGLLGYFMQRSVDDFRRDALTGLLLRHDLESAFNRALAQSRKAGKGLALIFMDLDHFKAINDTHGHGGGDTVLEQVAQTVQRLLRDHDAAIRYGGEEFLLLLPAVACEQVTAICERLRSAIESTLVYWEDQSIPVTASIGCVCTEQLEHEPDLDALIQQADENLYQAKENGRNQVVCSSATAS